MFKVYPKKLLINAFCHILVTRLRMTYFMYSYSAVKRRVSYRKVTGSITEMQCIVYFPLQPSALPAGFYRPL